MLITSLVIGQLAANSQYFFSVRSFDAVGNSSVAFASATTEPCPVGYVNDTCSQCAVGFQLVGGMCVPN